MFSSNLISVVGPTAVGKTELCIRLAKHFNSEIISADSRQCFKELNIGTAKPNKEELNQIKHHFINSHSIEDDFNVNSFEQEALTILNKLFCDNNKVILTGGSGLYIDALCQGFDFGIPGANEEIREELEEIYYKYGIGILQNKLKQLDPKFYAEIDSNNVKRLYRAIEVCMVSGSPYSDLRKGIKTKRSFNVIKIGLDRERVELFERINKRVDQMVTDGLLEEVKSVSMHRGKNALKTVGYRELFNFLDNNCTLKEAIENIKTNSRRYAKKQLGWFKKNDEYTWFHPDNVSEIIDHIQELS